MDVAIIQYTMKDGRADDNSALVTAIFDQLGRLAPSDFSYTVMEMDGGRFMHIVSTPDGGGFTLTELPAFEAFQADFASRVEVQPVRVAARLIGRYVGQSKQAAAAAEVRAD